MLSRRLMLVAAAGALLVTSCTYLRQLVGWVAEKPQVKVVDIEVKAFTSDRIELVFVLDIFNPNSFTLDVDRLDYQIHGLKIELGKGSMLEPVVLKGESHTPVLLPLSVNPEAGRQMFRKYLLQPRDLKLKLNAQLYLNTALGKMDMHFEESRTLVKGLPGS